MKTFKVGQIIRIGTGKFEVIEVSERLVLRNLKVVSKDENSITLKR